MFTESQSAPSLRCADTRHTLRHMARAPRRSPAAQTPSPTGMPPTDGTATPRSARGHAEAGVPWTGCELIPADPSNPKTIPAGLAVGLKVELLGWPKMGSVAAYTCKSPAPIDVLKNIDHTPDNLHRMYGASKIQVQAWTLSETGGTVKPIQAKVWTFEPCEFDDPDPDTDPLDPEDDVGTERWTVGPSALQADQRLRAELTRRNEVRRDLAQDDGFDDEEDEDDDRPSRGRGRGGRQSARGGSGNRRDWGRDRPGMGGGRPMPHRGGDVPEEFYNPDAVLPLPAPGMEWGWDDRAGHHRQFPKGTAPVVAPVVAPVPEKTPFFETSVGAALLGTIVSVGGAIVQKAMEPKPAAPDPMAAFATLMAALGGSKGDPERLKQLEIDAEDRRARVALEAEERRIAAAQAAENARIEREERARAAQAEAAEKQRAHDAKMETERREAARVEAIAAEERAKQRAIESRNELITLQRLGLDPNAKPQRSEDEIRNAIKAEMLVEQLKKERDAALGTGDIAAQIKRAEAVLKAAGIDVSTEASKSMLMDFFNTKAGEVAVGTGLGIVDRLVNMFTAAKGGAPTPAAPGGSPTVQLTEQQLNDLIRQRQEEAFRVGVEQARLEQERAAQAAQAAWEAQQAGQVPGVPVPEQMPPADPPPMGQWQAVPAPVEQAPETPADAPQEPPAEAPADPAPEAPPPSAEVPAEAAPEAPAEVPPVVEDAPPAPETPPADAAPVPAPEAPAEGESDGQRSRRLRDAAPVDLHPVIDRAPEVQA